MTNNKPESAVSFLIHLASRLSPYAWRPATTVCSAEFQWLSFLERVACSERRWFWRRRNRGVFTGGTAGARPERRMTRRIGCNSVRFALASDA